MWEEGKKFDKIGGEVIRGGRRELPNECCGLLKWFPGSGSYPTPQLCWACQMNICGVITLTLVFFIYLQNVIFLSIHFSLFIISSFLPTIPTLPPPPPVHLPPPPPLPVIVYLSGLSDYRQMKILNAYAYAPSSYD